MGKGVARYLSALVSSLALMAGGVGAFAVLPATAASGNATQQISADGTTVLTDGVVGTGPTQGPESAQSSDPGSAAADPSLAPTLPDRSKSDGKSGQGNNSGESGRDSANTSQLLSFDGLNHVAQRFANGGNQFSIEPPDQGLCAGNGYVLETINDVMAVYDDHGNRLRGPVDLNTFLNYAAAINRSTGARGPSVTDPSCYYDLATKRWFHVALTLGVVPTGQFAGQLTGANQLDIAVSQTSSPLGAWTIYHLPIQDDGTAGTPDHLCTAGNPLATWRTNPRACLGDYPHIGADANGFYITTNEYSLFGSDFKGAQIYAISKQQLAAGSANLTVATFNTQNAVRGIQSGFTVWPAESPNGQADRSRGGTEFFMSSNAADEVNPTGSRMSNQLIVWALTNTSSINSAEPDLSLSDTVVSVNRYAVPPASNQKVGSTPLVDCLNDNAHSLGPINCWQALLPTKPAATQVESTLDSNDSRMQQVTFADGMLFGALDTALRVNGKTQAGIEWFATRPHVTGVGVKAQLVKQGYVGAADTNVTYPALTVNDQGLGAMAFTLVGTNDYPSAAYAPFDARTGMGSIHIAAAGAGPEDGFTAHAPLVAPNPARPRWGDYGAAVVDGSHIWMASEYIGQTCTFAQYLVVINRQLGTCGMTRTSVANWDTRITELAIG
ncbi:MAG TPA: hypothetical protein VGG90_13640 [Candidatus Dormibacteraeota bacterium]